MDGEPLPAAIVNALDFLDRGATVVTGNQRAARTLRRAFDRHNRSLGRATWQPADAIAWDAWTAKLWRRLLIDGHVSQLLLNRTQEHTLWRAILDADRELRSLRSKDSLAEMAADAWQRLCSYRGEAKLRGAAGSSDSRSFQRWSIEFQRRCRDGNFLPQAQLEAALHIAAESGQLRLAASEIVLVGFDRMTPAQKALTDAVHSTGCRITALHLAVPAQDRLLVHAQDETEERYAAARWTRGFIEQHPSARVAIILPALQKHRAEIDRVFREVLAPKLQDITASDEAPYEFSLGTPLTQPSIVSAALALLRWAAEPLPLERVSALLLSPCFAMRTGTRNIRAEFDAFELRTAQRLRPEIPLDWLCDLAATSRHRLRLGSLSTSLSAMRRVATRIGDSERQTHTEWAGRMRELLQAADWSAPASGVQFQARNKWEDALDELAMLDFDGARVSYTQAVESIERIARQTMFAPESHDAPVQIMGAFEAAGATFDTVWFLGAGDLDWPIAAGTNHMLPWHLQRELGMPGTEIARDSEDARQTTERIAASAPTAIFSYAIESSAGRQRPSPALRGLHLEQLDAGQFTGPEPERQVIALETVEDSTRAQPPHDGVVRGGSTILRLQAACGFRAFAEQRLWSTEIEQPEFGMNLQQRGTAVHRALELFWNEVKTQQALKEMPLATRTDLLNRCITQSLEKIAATAETAWDRAYLQMQHGRLHRLLEPWLELELRRPPFEVKLSEERRDDAQVGPLRLHLRVDRVDLVEGGEVLIDYKTGAYTPGAWLSERPDEPQLPLYATLSHPGQLQAVAFGLVRAGEHLDLTGFEAHDGVLPRHVKMKEAPDLDAQVNEWRRVLVKLATDFYNGDASVSPKKYPATCERCAQRTLCRLNVSLLQLDNATEDARG